MKTIKQEIKDTPIGDLTTHPRNPRRGNLESIGSSIASNGFYGTIVAQKSTGYVLAGNHRLMAARKAGAKSLPVAWVDVDDDRALRILLVDNKTSDDSENDSAVLRQLLDEISDTSLGLDGTGFDAIPPEEDPDLVVLDPKPPPRMAWVLIGIPLVRFGEVQETIDRLASVEGVEIHTTANDG